MLATSPSVARPRADLSVQGLVLDLDKFATHDGPGIRTTVYLKGCPLQCAWCHSPESRSPRPQLLFQTRKCTGCGLCLPACPANALALVPRSADSSGAETALAALDWSRCDDCGACAVVCYPGALKIAGQTMTVGQVADEVEKDRAFFEASGGGVTLTGGETAHQPLFAVNLLRACQERGIHTAVETTGYAPWRVYADFAAVTDLFLFDIKHMESDQHRHWTGVANRLIHENLRRLTAAGARVVVRVPCIPGINDSPAHVTAIAAAVHAAGVAEIHLMPYNAAAGAKYAWLGRDYPLAHLHTQETAAMETLAEICRARGLETRVGG